MLGQKFNGLFIEATVPKPNEKFVRYLNSVFYIIS